MELTYDEFGNQQSVTIGNSAVVSQEKNQYNGKVISATYSNEVTVLYEYDHLDRIVKITYNKSGSQSVVHEYEYDSNGNICKYVNGANNTTTIYEYDVAGKLIKMVEYDSTELVNLFSTSYTYDGESRIKNVHYFCDYPYNLSYYEYLSHYYTYQYNDTTDSSLKRILVNIGGSNGFILSNTYDDFGRYITKEVRMGSVRNTVTFGYESDIMATSSLISSYESKIGSTVVNKFNYIYDEGHKNIEEIRNANGEILYRYEYDSLDRLIREDNSVKEKNYVYTYDNNGNILSEKVYAYTLGSVSTLTPTKTNTYTYGNDNWKDQLTSYNGVSINYDEMGNPKNYRNGMTFTWNSMNSLASVTKYSMTYTYTYNDSGIRTSKTVGDEIHHYYLEGSKIVAETYGDTVILYLYDETGSIIGMAYRDSTYTSNSFDRYLFTKNIQGDVIGIYDTTGNCVASYTYNAWGECTVINTQGSIIGTINPFRYRGYYYVPKQAYTTLTQDTMTL